MADTVTTLTITDQQRFLAVHLTCVSDATGETGVKKVDIATLKNLYSVQPTDLRIARCRWSIQGFTYVLLAWDRASAHTAIVISGPGYEDFTGYGEGFVDIIKTPGLIDPGAADGDAKGSILLTSVGAAAGATYDITLWLEKAGNKVAP